MPAVQPVSPPTLPSEQLADLLERQVRARLRGVSVRVQESGIVLHGCVPTYYSKQLAQHLVMGLTELPILANEIEVR